MLRPALPQIEWQGPGFCLSTDLRYLTKLYRSPCRGGAGALGDRDTVRAGAVGDIPQDYDPAEPADSQGAPVWAEGNNRTFQLRVVRRRAFFKPERPEYKGASKRECNQGLGAPESHRRFGAQLHADLDEERRVLLAPYASLSGVLQGSAHP